MFPCDYDPDVADRTNPIEDTANADDDEPKSQRVLPWALVISLIPVVGFAGGAFAIVKGWRRTGRYMILIALAINLLYAVATSAHG
jgi:hypothetical protein